MDAAAAAASHKLAQGSSVGHTRCYLLFNKVLKEVMCICTTRARLG